MYSTVSSCAMRHVHGLTLLCFRVPPPSEQKPKARPQSPAQHRRPRWPPLLGFTGVTGCHVRGRRTYSLHPRQPGSCQPACGAINQPDKGPLTRYAMISALLYHRNVLIEGICFMVFYQNVWIDWTVIMFFTQNPQDGNILPQGNSYIHLQH